jgi:V8-like Glu-specific endopeptidase
MRWLRIELTVVTTAVAVLFCALLLPVSHAGSSGPTDTLEAIHAVLIEVPESAVLPKPNIQPETATAPEGTKLVCTPTNKGTGPGAKPQFSPAGRAPMAPQIQNPQPVSGKAPLPPIREYNPAGTPKLKAVTPGVYEVENPESLFAETWVRVSDPSLYPYSVHGHMVMTFPNGKTYIGSGTLVGPHHVLTAGHCVYDQSLGGQVVDVIFNAGQNEDNLPFGSARATSVYYPKKWKTGPNNRDFDLGLLVLDKDVGNAAGYFGLVYFDNDNELKQTRVNVTGYPGNKGGKQMWTGADVIARVSQERFFYYIDTYGGNSGSGVWGTWPGQSGEKVCGVHTTGGPESVGNGATRMTKDKFDLILSWINGN